MKIALNFEPGRTVSGWFKDKVMADGTVITKLTNIYTTHIPEEGEYWVNRPESRFADYHPGKF